MTEATATARSHDPLAGCAPDLIRAMALAREADRREGILYRQGRGWFLLHSAGHESMAVFAEHLRDDDYKFLYYRDRAVLLALGWSIYRIALEYFAREDSSSGGRQMPAFSGDRARNIVSMAPPTGLQCLPATGCAWACKLRGEGQIVLCTIGDAATRQGEFYEALCFASEHRLPIVFVVEDNEWGISTPTTETNPLALSVLNSQRFVRVDGRRPEILSSAAAAAIELARMGLGPSVLWVSFDRLGSHSASDDQRIYRTREDLECMAGRDYLGNIPSFDGLQAQRIDQFVAEEYDRAEAADAPRSQVCQDVTAAYPRQARTHRLPQQATWTMASAITETLGALLAEDSRVMLCGQDIEDPKGGVFGLTRGLSSAFGGRVVNAPLAEATIAGVASGLALAGYLPIFEIQFIDFAGPAFHQIVNQIATLRWRSKGTWTNPLILMMPIGGYLAAAGPWHSQSNEGVFAHAPGLQIVVPSTPDDASVLLRAAAAGDDPVLFLIPKHLLRQVVEVMEEPQVRIGEARIRRTGSDATVVSWGNCVELAMQAASVLERERISTEVIDLRSLVPCDWGAIQKSLEKTGRIVVVQEDNRTCSFGQSIIAEIASRPDMWNLLAAKPELVSRSDSHIGFHPDLSASALPCSGDVVNTVRQIVRSESFR